MTLVGVPRWLQYRTPHITFDGKAAREGGALGGGGGKTFLFPSDLRNLSHFNTRHILAKLQTLIEITRRTRAHPPSTSAARDVLMTDFSKVP